MNYKLARACLILPLLSYSIDAFSMTRKAPTFVSEVTVLTQSEVESALEATLTSENTETLGKGDTVFNAIPWKTLTDIRKAFPNLHIPSGAKYVLLSMILPSQVSAGSEASETSGGRYLNLPVAMIFAREVLEAAVIYTNYRTAIQGNDHLPQVDKNSYLKAVNRSALGGIGLGVAVSAAIGLGTYYGGKDFEDIENGVEIAEGVSKLIASFFVAHLSLEIPKWLGLSPSQDGSRSVGSPIQSGSAPMSQKLVSANVFWNLLREFGEVGIFLVPAILAGDAQSIPASGAMGAGIATAIGAGYYFGAQWLGKKSMAIGAATVTGLLATGLFSGALHAFEEVAGETSELYDLGKSMNHKELPFALASPFGYSAHPTVLQTTSWWSFAVGISALHVAKYYYGVSAAQVWDYCKGKVCRRTVVETPRVSEPSAEVLTVEPENHQLLEIKSVAVVDYNAVDIDQAILDRIAID